MEVRFFLSFSFGFGELAELELLFTKQKVCLHDKEEHMTDRCAERRMLFVSDGLDLAVYSVYSTQEI